MSEKPETALTTQNPIMDLIPIEYLKQQTQQLDQLYRGIMQEGVDYGKIPGTDKPTLLKSGAELLRLRAKLAPSFTINNAGTDLKAGIFNYEVSCKLYRDGDLVGEGVGSCNSLEGKYRFRWVFESALPAGIDKAAIPSKPIKARGNWTKLYRIENENPQDLANTILKMAKKRAFVDAILTVTGASRIFTQDVEDFQENPPTEETPQKAPTETLSNTEKSSHNAQESPVTETLDQSIIKPPDNFLQGQKPKATPGNIRVINAHKARLGDDKFWAVAHELNIQSIADLDQDTAAALIGALSKAK